MKKKTEKWFFFLLEKTGSNNKNSSLSTETKTGDPPPLHLNAFAQITGR